MRLPILTQEYDDNEKPNRWVLSFPNGEFLVNSRQEGMALVELIDSLLSKESLIQNLARI